MSHRLDLSKFRGSDSEGEEEAPIRKRALELNTLKSKTFSHGITKKSKKDLEREAEEKKRVEEENGCFGVCGIYGSFRWAERREGPAGWIESRLPRWIRSSWRRSHGADGSPRSSSYGVFEAAAPDAHKKRTLSTHDVGFQAPWKASHGLVFGGNQAVRPEGWVRAYSCRDQRIREAKYGKEAKMEGSSVAALAARDREMGGGDSDSERFYIDRSDEKSNLPSNITEESLGLFSAKLGPVATVKIMWPRGDEDSSIGAVISSSRRAKPGLSGFVSYMTRPHAEKAVRDLNGMDWGGSVLRVGWSKPVTKPAKALYDLSNAKRGRSSSPSRGNKSRRRRSSTSPSPSSPRRKRARSDSGSSSDSSPRPPKKQSAAEEWLAKVPLNQAKLIQAVADKVQANGQAFEETLKTQYRDKAEFQFLIDEKIPAYHLYRRCLDPNYRVPNPPPADFEDEGYASLYSSDSAEDSEREHTTKGTLGRLARKRFVAILRAMSGKRVEIARGMEFAVTRAEAADEASSLPNVWKYRHAFETRLEPIFAHLASVYDRLNAYSGRISADVFKQQVGAVLAIWERWIVFHPDSTTMLRSLLDGVKPVHEVERVEEKTETPAATAKVPKFKTSGFKSSFVPLAAVPEPVPVKDLDVEKIPNTDQEPTDDVDGEPMDTADVDGEPIETASVDGDPMNEVDVDGEPMEDMDVDGEPMEDVDASGEPMEEVDVDGEPMDEVDVDGEPMDEVDVDGEPMRNVHGEPIGGVDGGTMGHEN
ncbi:hypothetical protein P7C73_g2781, partial [Tremellales sp. Uapishka_1]